MDDSAIAVIVIAVLLAVAAIWLCVKLILWTYVGAVLLWLTALSFGILGVVAYVACWVFLFPLMLTTCVLVGLLGWIVDVIDRRAEREWRTGRRTQWQTLAEYDEMIERTRRANESPLHIAEGDFPR